MKGMTHDTAIYHRFSQWVRRTPNDVAVAEDGRSVTYRELDRMVDSIMSKFYDRHYTAVGIVMSHGIEMIAAILAVLKSGAAYVPAEPSLPQQRVDYMMRTAGAEFVITDDFCCNLPDAAPLPDRSEPDDTAYILYTSGTSGRPKGVMVQNFSVVNYAEAFESEFHVGPGETTVCATYFRVDNASPLEDGTYPIGKAIKGVEVRILDDNLEELPDGRTGEICIYGRGVSHGYIGDPPEQVNFVTLADGTRMYRSGDLGYRLPDGNIAFLRRKDRQVMILGKRVEPAEVENVLNESPCVERGVVRAFTDEHGLAYLTAYFVPSHKNCRISRIKSFLRSRLADFMIPEFFVRMDEIPMTVRGKVNDRALPVVMKEGGVK